MSTCVHPDLRFGLSNEFVSRADGWPGLRAAYELPHPEPRGMQHDLAYRGLAASSVDVIDLYSTDPEIEYYHLRRLEDDRGYFPRYEAVILYRQGLRSAAVEVLARLEGTLDEDSMAALNAAVKLDIARRPGGRRVPPRAARDERRVPRGRMAAAVSRSQPRAPAAGGHLARSRHPDCDPARRAGVSAAAAR
jgi:hypothetical protein